jgi:hypothetical protein
MAIDITKPSIEALSYVLKNKNLWPRTFNWFYSDHYNCAIGLAAQLWPKSFRDRGFASSAEAASVLGMRIETSYDIFLEMHKHLGIEERDVTPEMVALELDKLVRCKS